MHGLGPSNWDQPGLFEGNGPGFPTHHSPSGSLCAFSYVHVCSVLSFLGFPLELCMQQKLC